MSLPPAVDRAMPVPVVPGHTEPAWDVHHVVTAEYESVNSATRGGRKPWW